MADDSASPLLQGRSGSHRSRASNHSEESAPLLSNSDHNLRYDADVEEEEEYRERIPSPAARSLSSIQESAQNHTRKRNGRRWPTIVAVCILGTLVLIIMAGAFFAPAIIEEYAKQSLVIEPKSLSIDDFTSNGVQARIQADFRLDASAVKNKAVRNIGRAGTWIVHKIESKESKVQVYLPEYGDLLLGTALIPGVVVNIRNGQTTHVDFVADLEPGNVKGIKRIANDWLEGRLGQLRVLGKADVSLKSGIFPLGTQSVAKSFVFEDDDMPSMPHYNITRIKFRDLDLPTGSRAVGADVSLSVMNDYPINFVVPPLSFDILVANCAASEPYIRVAEATTREIVIEPKRDVSINVGGIVKELPEEVTKTCPNSDLSPLDVLLGEYIHGEDATVYVRGSSSPAPGTPDWITAMISSIVVPVPFPGHTFGDLIKDFSISDVSFGLPDPFANPNSPEASPSVSGNIQVLAALPKEINFDMNVTRVRSTADVYHEGKKFGVLDLKKWQKANSTKVTDESNPGLRIESRIKDAPLNVTDNDVFTDVVSLLLFGDKSVTLNIKALVDVEVLTALGDFVIRDIPAEGNIPVKPISNGGFSNLNPEVGELKILDTSKTAITLQAKVNVTNPTDYTANIPYVNIHILKNGSIIGDAVAKNVQINKGNNTNIVIEATWDPFTFGGKKAHMIGRDLLSQYISGWNTTLTFRTHNGSFPSQPALGQALSKFDIEIVAPRLTTPGDKNDGGGDDDGDDDDEDDRAPHFIKEATFHLFSSTATFILQSPLQFSSIYIDDINATAFYNHTDPVGKIIYDLPFKVPPGTSETPRLPVDWSIDSVGYEAVRKALGGGLKLDAKGVVSVRLGLWTESVWYVGGGIGALVRL